MPRPPRIIVPGVTYHLISRFVAREYFITSDDDRRRYLTLLGVAIQQSTWRCLGYAVMSNHVHLAVVAGAEPLRDWLRRVHGPFAEGVNRARKRIGALFVRGPNAIEVAETRLGQLLGYIHHNPVRAAVCERPEDSTWTSHRAYLGLEAPPPWLAVEEGLRRVQAADGSAFDLMVQRSHEHPVLGDATSDEHLEQLIDAYERERIRELRRRRTQPALDAMQIVGGVARELGVDPAQMRSTRRSPAQSLGRRLVIECGVRAGCSARTIADALALTPQSVNRIARRGPLPADEQAIVTRIMAVTARGRRTA